MIAKTDENINKLATEIIESWDMKSLIAYAIDSLEQDFSDLSNKEFTEQWDDFFDGI
jgi:hypothetical protein